MSELCGGGRLSWIPSVADPGNPTAAELDAAVYIGDARIETGSLSASEETYRTIREVIGRGSASMTLRNITGPDNYQALLEYFNQHDFQRYAKHNGADDARTAAAWAALSPGIRGNFHAQWVLWALASEATHDHPVHGVLWCPTCNYKSRKVGRP